MNNTKKHKKGDIREDKMVFWCYTKSDHTSEHWLTRAKYEEKKNAARLRSKQRRKDLQLAYNNHPTVFSCGDTREDGMVFWRYSITAKGFEQWVTPKKHKSLMANNRSYQKKRRHHELHKLRGNIHNCICASFSRRGFKKTSKTFQILGCTYDEFVAHITSQFTDGMTLDNHGKFGWELDHRFPVSAATTEEELLALNYYTNFQPMWRQDNQQKKDKHCPKELKAYLQTKLST